MKQVLAIHGGDSFETYQEFWVNLAKTAISFELSLASDWKRGLAEALGPGYEVILPRMPNAQNARYAEWSLWFEKFTPHLTDGALLVGHSLGASFLAKYLSEHTVPFRIGGVFLVAAPFNEDGGRALPQFSIENDLAGLARQAERIFLYHSTDDPVVAFSELAKYERLLLQATARTFTDRTHFRQAEFPELVADIRGIA